MTVILIDRHGITLLLLTLYILLCRSDGQNGVLIKKIRNRKIIFFSTVQLKSTDIPTYRHGRNNF
jgi:hypothetical protein